MAFQLSPGVLVTEKDLTNIVPAVATSSGAFAGAFVWGPVLDPTAISSENQLVARFGKPVTDNAAAFFSAANFLSYTNNLLLVRVDTNGARNAVAVQSGGVTDVTISNGGTGYLDPVVTFSAPNVAGGIQATGHAVLSANVITDIVIDNPGSGYTSTPTIEVTDEEGINFAGAVVYAVSGVKIKNEDQYQEEYANGAGVIGQWAAKYPGALGNSLKVSMADADTYSTWPYRAEFDTAPGTSDFVESRGGSNDELHVIIVDEDGLWTGTRGAIVEKFAYLSKASDARKSDGTNNYYKDAINNTSKYIWWTDHPASGDLLGDGDAWGQEAANSDFDSLDGFVTKSLSGGVDDLSPTDGNITDAYAIFANAETYDVSLIVTGHVSASVAKNIVDNVAEVRRDCVVFISPVDIDTGEMISGVDAVDRILDYRNGIAQSGPVASINSSYAVLDSGFKYQYDRYNDKYRWVPLNADVAGLCARTDYTNDPWWSPSGMNRGQIKNIVKLAVNLNKSNRDDLYKVGVNPVVSFPGQGVVLFGDKTMLAKPSAFDRINVRRLFIVLEKAIATAAKYQLFEFNDPFTRAQFRSLVEPFLRDVQGRRGLIEFRVVCNETNNTGEVIDRNEFIADIFIKPTRSINFITLNFVAARSGISFDEIGG